MGDFKYGGNAKVSFDRDKNIAKKELVNKKDDEKRLRFVDEINIMNRLKGRPGIIPIIENDTDNLWYTMPIAEPIEEHLNKSKNRFEECKIAISQLIGTLKMLHNENIYHRDIKIDNLYYYNGKYCFGDFGLVDFPDKQELTNSKRGLGAWTTIAPEMKRDPRNSDGAKADIYSFAKTIWIILTRNKKGFDGKYDYLDSTISLRYMPDLKEKYLVDIERLLHNATDNNPNNRLSADELEKYIHNWIATSNDRELAQKKGWEFISELLFGNNPQKSAQWDKKDVIVRILNIISSFDVLNHCFFSDGGGLDFEKAECSTEEGFIDLIMGGFINRVKPKILYFESFNNQILNYFKLDYETVEKVFKDKNYNNTYEILCEDFPKHYVDAKYFQYGVYDYDTGEPLPKTARIVNRYCSGSLLIVNKLGIFNRFDDYSGKNVKKLNDEIVKMMNSIDELINLDKNNQNVKTDKLIDIIINGFRHNENYRIDNENLIEKQKRIKYDEFFKTNICNLEFEIKDNVQLENCKIAYYIEFIYELKNLADFTEILLMDRGRLENFPRFAIKDKNELKNIAYFNDIEKANLQVKACEKIVTEEMERKKIEAPKFPHPYFKIKIKRGKILPLSPIFTKDNLKKLMREADDRLGNDIVVDSDGNLKMLSGEMCKCRDLYPVSLEHWGAGSNEVGKYSSLLSVDETYKFLLYGWLNWLRYGINMHVDYIKEEYNDEQKLLDEINIEMNKRSCL